MREYLLTGAVVAAVCYLVTPFIPLFVLELVGHDPIAAATWSGIALGISPLMTAVAGPFWGSFAAKYGSAAPPGIRKKSMYWDRRF